MRAALGFTLIGVLVTVAIMGILAAIAIPDYEAYIAGTRRTAAQACLLDYGSYMQRYYAQHMHYNGAVLPTLGCAQTDHTGAYYAYSLTSVAPEHFIIAATAQGQQADYKPACKVLTVDEAGATTPVTNQCWRQ